MEVSRQPLQESTFRTRSSSFLGQRWWMRCALALSPGAADLGKGGCRQQLRTRTLHHREGDRLLVLGRTRKLADNCTGLQGFSVYNACGGSTGSEVSSASRCGPVRRSQRLSLSRTTLSCSRSPCWITQLSPDDGQRGLVRKLPPCPRHCSSNVHKF